MIMKKIKENFGITKSDKLIIEIKREHCAREFFGIIPKWNTPTQKIKNEMRKGW